jgi:hypothetical protein
VQIQIINYEEYQQNTIESPASWSNTWKRNKNLSPSQKHQLYQFSIFSFLSQLTMNSNSIEAQRPEIILVAATNASTSTKSDSDQQHIYHITK